MFSESKDEVAIILCGSKLTWNDLADERSDAYHNIMVVRSLDPVTWDLIHLIESEIKPSDVTGDCIL